MSNVVNIMNSKVEYALRAIIDLAERPAGAPVQSKEIASRQNIPGPYLDQILSDLKRAQLIKSIRGANGGYLLDKATEKITVGDVMRSVSGDVKDDEEANMLNEDCANAVSAVIVFRNRLEKEITSIIDQYTIEDLISIKQRHDDVHSYMPNM